MPEGPDGSEFGPASQFFLNVDYYEAMGESLRLRFDDHAEVRLFPRGNFRPENIEQVDLGIHVRVPPDNAVHVEQVRVGGEAMEEIVEWVAGAQIYQVKSWHDDNVNLHKATEVEIVD